MAKTSKVTKNQLVPIFIENKQFESPEAYTAFCLDRAANMTSQEKHALFADKLESRALYGLGAIRESYGVFYESQD
jgi:hypothetical protein